jgi:hypothetical protein
MVRFPPDNTSDAGGWAKALLTDLAGWPDCTADLLEAVWDVQSGRASEWVMNYNVYTVVVQPDGAMVTFQEYSCRVPLGVLETVIAEHLGV